jgi:pyruvate/2-oxoacid:ferredoxin oxidoreductase alpha subunit
MANNLNVSVNYENPNLDLSVRVFDSFYDYNVNVPAAEYDVVRSYFLGVMTSPQAANNFTVSLFRIAEQTNIPALTLLQQFQGNTGINLSATLAYYLNSIRNGAVLLGVNARSTPNFYAARNVVQ